MNNINYEYIEEILQREVSTSYGVYDDDGQFHAPCPMELYEATLSLPQEERVAYLRRYYEILESRAKQRRRPRETQIALKE